MDVKKFTYESCTVSSFAIYLCLKPESIFSLHLHWHFCFYSSSFNQNYECRFKKVTNDNIYEYMRLGNTRRSLVPVPRLISRDIFFIEKNSRGYWYVCKIHFVRHRAKKESSRNRVSSSCRDMYTTCRSPGFIWCKRDISSSILPSATSPDRHVSCEGKLSIVDR